MMTCVDAYGLTLSTGSQSAAAAYRRGIDKVLSHRPGAESEFHEALSIDPSFAVAQASMAACRLMSGDPVGARHAIGAAITLGMQVGRREREYVLLVAHSIRGTVKTAQVLRHMREHGPNPLAAQLVLLHLRFSSIDSHVRVRTHKFLSAISRQFGHDYWFLAAYAFSYQELENFEVAFKLATKSIELNPYVVCGRHAMAHVLDATGDHVGASSILREWMPTAEVTPLLYRHCVWHVAIAALAKGDSCALDSAIDELTVGRCSVEIPIEDQAALSWWCQLVGYRRPPSAEDMDWAIQCAERRPRRPFHLTFLAIAYAARGDTVKLDELRHVRVAGEDPLSAVTREVVAPLIEALAAFVRGEYAAAARFLAWAYPGLKRLGGSRIYREVLEDTLIVAATRCGQKEIATSILRERLERSSAAYPSVRGSATQVKISGSEEG